VLLLACLGFGSALWLWARVRTTARQGAVDASHQTAPQARVASGGRICVQQKAVRELRLRFDWHGLDGWLGVFHAKGVGGRELGLGVHVLCVMSRTQEKSRIHVFIEDSVKRLQGSDRFLPQVTSLRSLLMRGIGVHHGGLLPIMKVRGGVVIVVIMQRVRAPYNSA